MATAVASHPGGLGSGFEPGIGHDVSGIVQRINPDDISVAASKKKKKKKVKKPKPPPVVIPPTPAATQDIKQSVLCINRNKHWKYISSYHGPWLQLPIELLDSLLVLNMNPNNFLPRDERIPPPPNGRRGVTPSTALTLHQPNSQPLPPPIDPGVFRSVTTIRRLIDEASDLAVRASSGLSASALGALRSPIVGNGPWATAQAFGINPLGDQNSGRSVSMSSTRMHRLRVLAVQKVAEAYKADEIAASVMIMQGATSLDDLAERVLKVDPNDLDAKYVHFFHEKIPSRQLAEFTTTKLLDELIEAQPTRLHYFRTRGVVRCFRDEYYLAIKDFSHVLKESRLLRKSKAAHRSEDTRHQKVKHKKRTGHKANGQAPPSGTSVLDGDEPEPNPPELHPAVGPDAPDAIEPQVLFLRAAAYLQSAVHLIEEKIMLVEGVQKVPAQDALELKLSLLEKGRFGGISSEGPHGPLGPSTGGKFKAYRENLGGSHFTKAIVNAVQRSIRDNEKFMTYFDTVNGKLPSFHGNLAQRIEMAFQLSESLRPGSHSPPPPLPENPGIFTTYHPLLIEAHFNVLIGHLLLGDFASALPAYQRAAALIDGLEGYPVFLPARSMAQAEFVEILERLASTWELGIQPHSFSRKQKLRIEAPPSVTSTPTLVESNHESAASTRTASPSTEGESPASSSHQMSPSLVLTPSFTDSIADSPYETTEGSPFVTDDQYALTTQGDVNFRAGFNLDALRILLAPVANRQREKVAKEAADKAFGKKKSGVAINIPLHSARVDIVLSYVAAVHLPDLELYGISH